MTEWIVTLTTRPLKSPTSAVHGKSTIREKSQNEPAMSSFPMPIPNFHGLLAIYGCNVAWVYRLACRLFLVFLMMMCVLSCWCVEASHVWLQHSWLKSGAPKIWREKRKACQKWHAGRPFALACVVVVVVGGGGFCFFPSSHCAA